MSEILLTMTLQQVIKNNQTFMYLKCCVCLELFYSPMQCASCESLVCHICLELLKLSGKKCFGKCKGDYKKANRFIREFQRITKYLCRTCNKDLDYELFYSNPHFELCKPILIKKERLLNILKLKEEKILSLQTEINCWKTKNKIYNRYAYSKLLKLPMEELRQILMTFDLSIDQKMELYYTCTEGRLDDFRNLILNKKYSILEEISYKNYYWTPLHYAMHYGQFETIKFILDYLKEQNIIEPALRLQSNDGRCPILCLLKSNNLSESRKEELFEKLLKNYYFSISKEIKREAGARGFEKIIKNNSKF
jgi:hypothetical protein